MRENVEGPLAVVAALSRLAHATERQSVDIEVYHDIVHEDRTGRGRIPHAGNKLVGLREDVHGERRVVLEVLYGGRDGRDGHDGQDRSEDLAAEDVRAISETIQRARGY